MNRNKRLYRSRQNRQLAGVCGGIADYLAIDATLLRLVWVIFALAGGPGFILYIIFTVIVPEEPEFVPTSAEKVKHDESV